VTRRRVGLALATLFLVALTAVACGSSGEACPPVELLAPGDPPTPVDLSGDWDGNDSGLYHIKQVDSCVWWAGVSNFPGQYQGEDWIMTFKGHVTTEGVIEGQFVDVKSSNPGSGTLTIEVRPEVVNGEQVVNLYRTAITGHPIGVTSWQRAIETPAGPPSFGP
jgi:hypothetical protein